MKVLAFLLMTCALRAWQGDAVLSSLVISLNPYELRLVYWHSANGGFKDEKEAIAFVTSLKGYERATADETRMFFDLYDVKTIKAEAKTLSRHYYRDGESVEILPKWFVVLYRPP